MTKINESISEKPHINTQIEKVLRTFPSEEQTHILDALELLQDAGEAGLSPKQWSDYMKQLYPTDSFSIMELLKSVVRKFPFCVRRAGEKHYVWDDSDRGIDDIDPEFKAAVKKQVDLSFSIIKFMKQLGEFTVNEIAQKLSQSTGIPLDAITAQVEQVISAYSGTKLISLGNGRYRVKEERKSTADDEIENLKRLAGLPGMEPTDET